MSNECNRKGCDGVCIFHTITGSDTNLKCQKCKYTSKGAVRGIFYKSRNIVYSFVIQLVISIGLSYQMTHDVLGNFVSKNA